VKERNIMKCPFRKQTDTYDRNNARISAEAFLECYKMECPFYVFDKVKNVEICKRAVIMGLTGTKI